VNWKEERMFDKRQLVNIVGREARRLTGREYQIDWPLLDLDSLREVQRLLRDLEFEKTAAVTRAKRMPWRR
jgi:hypothetical protein